VSGTDDLSIAVRVLAGIVVVLVLVALSARVARRAGVRGPGTGLRVLDRVGLSREASVAVIEVAGKALVVGVTAHGVNVLGELDSDALAKVKAAGTQPQATPRLVRLPSAVDQGASCAQEAARRGSGSVLSPATWRQGIDALRDLTARRSTR
jgi:flagellar protein FliO/FliZ